MTQLADLEPQVWQMEKTIEGLKQLTAADALYAAKRHLATTNKVIKALEDSKTRATDPETGQSVNELKLKIESIESPYKFLLGCAQAQKFILSEKIAKYETEENERLAEQQRQAQIAHGEELAKVALGEKSLDEVPPPAYVPTPEKTVHFEDGTKLTTAMHWTWRIPGIIEDGKVIKGANIHCDNRKAFIQADWVLPPEYFMLDVTQVSKDVRANPQRMKQFVEVYQKPRYGS